MKNGHRLSALVKMVAVVCCVLAVSIGCGGGGGSSTTYTLTGFVEDVATGVPTTQAQVQIGSSGATVLTSATDGSFTLSAPAGTTFIEVNRRDGSTPFVFTIPAVAASENVGTLWIGPTKISASGRALDSATLKPISGASVSLGGIVGTTATDGTFNLSGVPYAASGLFPNLPGQVSATGYITAAFEPGNLTPSAGVVAVGDIGLVASNGSSSPGAPFNLWGRVSPLADASGATVTLSLNGTPYRSTTVASDGTYHFWVLAGTYTISISQTGFSAPPISATLSSTSQVLEEDVTLTANP